MHTLQREVWKAFHKLADTLSHTHAHTHARTYAPQRDVWTDFHKLVDKCPTIRDLAEKLVWASLHLLQVDILKSHNATPPTKSAVYNEYREDFCH